MHPYVIHLTFLLKPINTDVPDIEANEAYFLVFLQIHEVEVHMEIPSKRF